MATGSDNFSNLFNSLSKPHPLLLIKPDGRHTTERDDAHHGLQQHYLSG